MMNAAIAGDAESVGFGYIVKKFLHVGAERFE
jgi:hypothetical protein